VSAAAARLPVSSPRPITAYCPVGLSYFDRLLSLNRPSEINLFGLVLVETLGKPGHPLWAEIDDRMKAESTNVSKEQYDDAAAALEKFGYIRSREIRKTGRFEYSVTDTFRDESHAKKCHGRCPHCALLIEIDRNFIPVPHVVLKKFGACLDGAAFACLMVIILHTLKYTRERGVYAVPSKIEMEEFERLTGYEESSITKALGRLCDPDGWALVQRKVNKGKASIFCPALENFFLLERKEARVVTMPTNRNKGENSGQTKNPKVTPIQPEPPESAGIESELKPYGFCKKCDRFVNVEQVSEEEFRREQSKSPPKAAAPPKKPAGRMQKMWDKLKQWHGNG
jgi:hypothetical protein